jgi:hypothetical protein
MEPLRVSSQQSRAAAGHPEPVAEPTPPEPAQQEPTQQHAEMPGATGSAATQAGSVPNAAGAAGAGSAANVGSAPGTGPGPGATTAQGGMTAPGATTAPDGTTALGATTAPGAKKPWKSGADGKTVFRLGTQFIIWWAWIAFAIFNVFELVLRDRDYFSLEVIAALLALTGLAYACTLRPRVLADDHGVLVHNPFQDHELPWGAVKGVYLGDSVEFTCARPAPKKDKTVYCWALYSGRRKRMRAQMQRSFLSFGRSASGRSASSRAPLEVREMSRLATVQIMAAELGRWATKAKADGAPDAVMQSRWCWPAIVFMAAPSAALLGLLLAK